MDETRYIGFFATGDVAFWLPMPRVIAAEREMGCSLAQLFHDLGEHLGALVGRTVLTGPSPATLSQCHALIGNALIGGGMGEQQARELVKVYAYPNRPGAQDMGLAWEILRAAFYGVQLESGKKKTEESLSPSTKGA